MGEIRKLGKYIDKILKSEFEKAYIYINTVPK